LTKHRIYQFLWTRVFVRSAVDCRQFEQGRLPYLNMMFPDTAKNTSSGRKVSAMGVAHYAF